MSETQGSTEDHHEPGIYKIRIKGHIDARWAGWFGNMTIRLEDNGDTLLTGPVVDQAGLHGLLRKVGDLGMPLISVNRVGSGRADEPGVNETHQNRSKRRKMNTSKKITEMKETKAYLSTLWIVVMINMAYADIFSLHIPGILEELTEFAEGTPITQLMLGGAIITEIPIAMIFLSRVLKHKVNRWVNIIAGAITIAYVIGGGSTYPHYIFIASIEVVCMALIIWLAWKWRDPEGSL